MFLIRDSDSVTKLFKIQKFLLLSLNPATKIWAFGS